MAEDRDTLRTIHELRLAAHGYTRQAIEASPWPKTEKEWRQTEHGAAWDTNVHMARWHLSFYHKLKETLENG